MGNNSILYKALNLYNINSSSIFTNKIGNSSNLIYEVEKDKDKYILRISDQKDDYLPYYEAECNYLNYLYKNNVSVSRIVPSINNNLVEVICENEKCYFIVLFTRANGHQIEVNNSEEWNEKLFYNWGKTMGKMHFVTKNYVPINSEVKRRQWNEDIYFDKEYCDTNDNELNKVWDEIITEINTLKKDKDSYGIIHNDFHQYNFFIYNNKITVFDFDDCLYSWYVCDIAISIYHALQTVPKDNIEKRKIFEEKFIKNFIKGYLSENYLSEDYLKRVPLFMEYRRICSYKFFKNLMNDKEISNSQKEYLNNMRSDVVNRVSCTISDFNRLITLK